MRAGLGLVFLVVGGFVLTVGYSHPGAWWHNIADGFGGSLVGSGLVLWAYAAGRRRR